MTENTSETLTPATVFRVIYRISDKGGNAGKDKIPNATKLHCLRNALEHFGRENFHVIADNCSQEILRFLSSEGLDFEETHLGNSPSFKYAVSKVASSFNDSDIVYFLEDDYLHLPDSKQLLIEALEIADYATLYDHPDQYLCRISSHGGAAPLNNRDLHSYRIFLTGHSHWREIPSTTMTFAVQVKTLREDIRILTNNPDSGTPDDFNMFLKLTKRSGIADAFNVLPRKRSAFLILMNNFAVFRKKRLLISCIPGRATHCETKWLSPLADWTKI